MTHKPAVDVDALAQEIRRVDGSHSLGAAALAEALAPYVSALTRPAGGSERLRELVADWQKRAMRLEPGSCVREAMMRSARELEEALASPQGAEQRQDNWSDAGFWQAERACAAIYGGDVWCGMTPDDKRAARARYAAHVATPHPAPAATQGDALAALDVMQDAAARADSSNATKREAQAEWARYDEAERIVRAALSSPPGVQAAQVSGARADGIAPRDRLWDSQWVNIVNHANCYRDMDKEAAVACAVKMTEQAMAANLAGSAAHGGEVSDDDEPCSFCLQRGCNGECGGDGHA